MVKVYKTLSSPKRVL